MKLKEHWDAAYDKTANDKLGWYEESPQPSLDLINDLALEKETLQFHAGAGSSTLIDHLVEEAYTNILVNDISSVALANLKSRLDKKFPSNTVNYICDDLTAPNDLLSMPEVSLWHDRAVLHFFRKDAEKKAYFNLVQQKVAKGGYVLLATFHPDGAKKCCGLDICAYDTPLFQKHLGVHFSLIKEMQHTFINPNGDPRLYQYALFQKL